MVTPCNVDGCERPKFCRGWCTTHYQRWKAHGDPIAVKNGRGMSLIDKFMARVDKRADGCWLWTGGTNASGYGRFALGHRGIEQAHRWSYEHHIGPIPDGLQIDHLCRVHGCVNPAHMEPVTGRENVRRGETLPAANAVKTHCPRGHTYDDANTYVSGRGERTCRTCRRDAARARRASSG